jgi:hypothetical protein
MRLTFSIPNEPSPELCRAMLTYGASDPDKLKRVLFDFFVSVDRPQTYILPRTVVRKTVETCVSHTMDISREFPKFSLETDSSKLIRCCYASVWRALLLEWKSRLILASGRTPADSELPSGFDPWIDLTPSENSTMG